MWQYCRYVHYHSFLRKLYFYFFWILWHNFKHFILVTRRCSISPKIGLIFQQTKLKLIVIYSDVGKDPFLAHLEKRTCLTGKRCAGSNARRTRLPLFISLTCVRYVDIIGGHFVFFRKGLELFFGVGGDRKAV